MKFFCLQNNMTNVFPVFPNFPKLLKEMLVQISHNHVNVLARLEIKVQIQESLAWGLE